MATDSESDSASDAELNSESGSATDSKSVRGSKSDLAADSIVLRI